MVVSKNCCYFISLRLGSFIINVICAVVESISLIVYASALWNTYDVVPDKAGYIYVERLIFMVFLVFTCFKLALCAALYLGLLERRPDHLEIWYKGYLVCSVLYLAYVILEAFHEPEVESALFWLILVGNILLTLINFYFIIIVRRYHHQMCRQPNFYRDFTCHQITKMYENPHEGVGEIVLFSATPTEKDCCFTPTFVKEGNGQVFATPQSSEINMIPTMPSFFLNNDRKPSVDVQVTEKECSRRSSTSKPTKQSLCVGFENHIDLE